MHTQIHIKIKVFSSLPEDLSGEVKEGLLTGVTDDLLLLVEFSPLMRAS